MCTGVPPVTLTVPLLDPTASGWRKKVARPAGAAAKVKTTASASVLTPRGWGRTSDVSYRPRNARLIATSVVRDGRANSSSSFVSAVRRPNRS
jgi:hypothetical protein